MVVMDKSCKSSLCDGEEYEQVGDHLLANKKTIKISTKNDSRVERFGKNERYPKKGAALARRVMEESHSTPIQ